MLCGVAVHDIVDLGGAHADMDMLCHFVKDRGVERGADPDLLDLLRRLQKLPGRDDLALFCVKHHFFLDGHVAFFVFFAAAAPAKLISFHVNYISLYFKYENPGQKAFPSETVDEKPAAQFGFKPGGFGRHQPSGVRHGQQFVHGCGIHGKCHAAGFF